MKMKLCVVVFLAAVLGLMDIKGVLAQSGEGDLKTVTFGGKVRLPNETFLEAYNDKTDNVYISFVDDFQEKLEEELRNDLDGKSVTYSAVNVTVTNLTSGSVNVAFLLTINGTTLSINELVAALESVSGDGKIGSFTAEQIQDLNECQETTVTCAEFAECVNNVGSFSCECTADFYDQSGNGTICITPAQVLCEKDKIEFSILKAYLENLNIPLSELVLANDTCGGIENATSGKYVFMISDGLTSCGTEVNVNDTHVTYNNTLTKKASTNAVIITGSTLSIPFSCSYPKNLTATLDPFEGEVTEIDIDGPNGTGTLDVALKLYTDSTFSTLETKKQFQTTETLFIQAELPNANNELAIVLNRCWATPTENITDAIQYDLIVNGCEVNGAVDGTINVISNGLTSKSRFSTQVFRFVDDNTTYVHCGIALCLQATGNCQPTCTSARRRRDIGSSTMILTSRVKRDTPRQSEETIGPFYRETGNVTEYDTARDILFWSVVLSLVLIIIILLVIISCLVWRRQKDKRTAWMAKKMIGGGEVNGCYIES